MSCKSRSIVVSVCLLLVLSSQLVVSAPTPYWWNQLFGVAIRPYRGQPQTTEANNRRPRDRFKAICRVISGDNYAFPGNVPFPSAPFCPHGDKWWRTSCDFWSCVHVKIRKSKLCDYIGLTNGNWECCRSYFCKYVYRYLIIGLCSFWWRFYVMFLKSKPLYIKCIRIVG